MQQRKRLVGERMEQPPGARAQAAQRIIERLEKMDLAGRRCIGFYWPLRGEPDLRPFVRRLLEQGAEAALPVVVEEGRPLEFWRWDAGTRMRRQEVWGIPVPAERAPAVPDALLIPLIGFDGSCHRLGHGGGYYDRTLAALEPRPFAIGVGLTRGRLDTIYPQPHDVPMQAIVTDEEALRCGPGS